jgi:hypothetical protein
MGVPAMEDVGVTYEGTDLSKLRRECPRFIQLSQMKGVHGSKQRGVPQRFRLSKVVGSILEDSDLAIELD